ncbi:hypothetical protein HID58_002645, partial [Brassica napus]
KLRKQSIVISSMNKGEWKIDHGGWEFILDPSKKGIALFVEDDTEYDDFLCMVCENYKISEMEAVEFAYMLPKRIFQQMPRNTPPIFLRNDIQLASFITLFKTDIMCIYVSLTANKCHHDSETIKSGIRENVAADFGSFGNVPYETMKPSHETMNQQPHETMKPSQLWKSETIKSGDIFSGKKKLIMKLRKLSVIKRFDFIIKKSWKHLFYAKREKAALFKTNLTEEAELTLHMRHANMGTLTVQHIDSNRSYVTGVVHVSNMISKRYPVNTQLKWLNVGILLKLLVDPLYTKGYLVEAYTDPINPTNEDLIPPADVLSQIPKIKRYLSAIEKSKRFKCKLLKKKNQTMSTRNPPPATKEGNQSSRNTSTKKLGCSQAPSTPIRQKQTNIPRRTPSTNLSSRKKEKYSVKITAPTTPSPMVRKGLFLSSPTSKNPTQGAKQTKSKKRT